MATSRRLLTFFLVVGWLAGACEGDPGTGTDLEAALRGVLGEPMGGGSGLGEEMQGSGNGLGPQSTTNPEGWLDAGGGPSIPAGERVYWFETVCARIFGLGCLPVGTNATLGKCVAGLGEYYTPGLCGDEWLRCVASASTCDSFSICTALSHYQCEVMEDLSDIKAWDRAVGGGRWRYCDEICLFWEQTEPEEFAATVFTHGYCVQACTSMYFRTSE